MPIITIERTKKVIHSLFPSAVHEKKVKKYLDAEWRFPTERDLEIPEDATVYFKEKDHYLWSLCSYFFEYKNGMVKGFWL